MSIQGILVSINNHVLREYLKIWKTAYDISEKNYNFALKSIYIHNNKDLLNSTGNYIQYLIKTYNGEEFEKVTHLTESLPNWITLLHTWN